VCVGNTAQRHSQHPRQGFHPVDPTKGGSDPPFDPPGRRGAPVVLR
jgi:hypothetical protein